MTDTERLADLERRLDALERRLAATEAAAAPPGAARSREELEALAADQRDLRGQVQNLLGALLAWREGRPAPADLTPPPLPPPSPAWKRLAGRALRLPLAAWRSLRAVYRGGDWSLAVPDPGRVPPALTPADVVVLGLSGPGEPPAGIVESALAIMACEDLLFVHLQGDADHLVLRRQLGIESRDQLEAGLRARLPRRRNAPLGRTVGLRVITSGAFPAFFRGMRRLDDHWRVGEGGMRYPLAAAPATRCAGAPGGLAIVASCPLERGLDRLLARLLAAAGEAGRPVTLISLVDVRGGGPFWTLADDQPALRRMPLASFFPPESLGLGLAQVLRREGCEVVFHLGPGRHFFDSPDVTAAIAGLPLFDLPLEPASTRPAGRARHAFSLREADGAAAIPLELLPIGPQAARDEASRRAARRRLGLPEAGPCWLWMDDLVAQARPEDLAELARRLPGHTFWMVGRGPLEGRVDDLLRYLELANVRRSPAADLAEAFQAADALIATSSHWVWPQLEATALAAGVSCFGPRDPRLAGRPGYHPVASLGELEAALSAGAPAELAPPSHPELDAEAGGIAEPWWRPLLALPRTGSTATA